MSLLGVVHTVERSGGEYVDGRYVANPITTTTFIGTIQPMPARENIGFREMPTGRVAVGRVRVYSRTALTPSKESGPKGDVVHYEGGRFEIIRDITHKNGIIPHYKYIAEYLGEVT